jgi:hypothetical protein
MPDIVRVSRRTPVATAIVAVAVSTMLLAGCGGGGDYYDDGGPPPGPALDRAAGFYEGLNASNRHVSVIVIETGRYYVLYGPTSAPSSTQIEGVLVGDGTASGSTFSSSTLQNLNFTNQTNVAGSMAATFLLRSYFDANLAYVGGATDAFNADYSLRYEDVPSLVLVAGNYSGQLASLVGVPNANMTISSSGAVSIAATGGCTAGGTILLHPFGNVYDVNLTFGAGCPAAGLTLSGHAKYDTTTGSLTAITTTPAITNTVLVVATKV